jgi:hypothetical protein
MEDSKEKMKISMNYYYEEKILVICVIIYIVIIVWVQNKQNNSNQIKPLSSSEPLCGKKQKSFQKKK